MRDHTSLVAWQKAREVTIASFRIAATQWSPNFAPALEQLRRAALSVQLNIAEGYALGSAAGFRRHLRIAYGSAVEVGEILSLMRDLNLVPLAMLETVLADSYRCQRLLLGLLHRKQPS